jgi:hypothetical protein
MLFRIQKAVNALLTTAVQIIKRLKMLVFWDGVMPV